MFKIGFIQSQSSGAVIPDAIPNSVNWDNIFYVTNSLTPYSFVFTSQRITGINVPIVLNLSFPAWNNNFYYRISSSFIPNIVQDSSVSINMILFSSNTNITLNPNEYLQFGCFGLDPSVNTLTIKNVSNGNTTLDTIQAQIITYDYRPNIRDWQDVYQDTTKDPNQYKYTVQQITGISADITISLQLNIAGELANYATFYYKLDRNTTNVIDGEVLVEDPANRGFIPFSSGDIISVERNMYLAFAVGNGNGSNENETATITIVNLSDNTTVLDTLQATLINI